jgi:hypothetical protein
MSLTVTGEEEEEEEFRVHHNMHSTLGVDTRATGARWRVESIEGGGIERRGKRLDRWGERE